MSTAKVKIIERLSFKNFYIDVHSIQNQCLKAWPERIGRSGRGIKNGKLLTSHRSTIYPCYLPVLGEFNRSWSYKTCRCKYTVMMLNIKMKILNTRNLTMYFHIQYLLEDAYHLLRQWLIHRIYCCTGYLHAPLPIQYLW
jgi:hypothetical protein